MMQCVTPISIIDKSEKRNPYKKAHIRQNVPCNKCGICKKNKRNEWTFRLRKELQHSYNSKFITLTYNEDNLPYVEKTGEPTIYKDDLQNFLKKLRESEYRRTGKRLIKYYAVGEYGTKSHRPHYHIIIFNLTKHAIDNLPNIWGKGHTDIGTVSSASIHYVTKYHVTRNHLSDNQTRAPERSFQSQGLGKQYLSAQNIRYHRDTGHTFVYLDGHMINMPKYFKNKIWSPEELELISEQNVETGYIEETKEIKRLKKLGHENPWHEMWLRNLKTASKIKNKHDDNDSKL